MSSMDTCAVVVFAISLFIVAVMFAVRRLKFIVLLFMLVSVAQWGHFGSHLAFFSLSMTRFSVYQLPEHSSGLISNTWNVSETFLNTPWFNFSAAAYNNDCSSKFQRFSSASQASQEVIHVSNLPQLNTASLYSAAPNFCFNGSLSDLSSGACKCARGSQNYIGKHCDVPESVWRINSDVQNLTLRSDRPRLVLMGVVVNHELDALEIRIRQLAHTVDLFIIMETSETAGGDPKPLYFWQAFRRGFLCEFHQKILYVMTEKFPDGYVENGWLADGFIRNYMSQEALKRIQGLRDDDLFLSFDADEIPKAEVVLFLKMHNGINDPIKFNLRWTLFKYYWLHKEMTDIFAGCSIGSLKRNYGGKVYDMRGNHVTKECRSSNSCLILEPFEIGVDGNYAGHHCSWCTTPEGISVKLRSALHQDFPRWGDYPEKLDIQYIRGLTQTGSWFDGSKSVNLITIQQDPDFAPDFVLSHANEYKDLLFHSDHII